MFSFYLFAYILYLNDPSLFTTVSIVYGVLSIPEAILPLIPESIMP